MSYTVCSSEKLRKSGAYAETKAMLYLMNFREDSSEMNYFVVDFFNDVTGMDRMGRKLWDVQSKASKTASAKGIGRELVTLGGADIFLDYFMLLIQDYVCTLPDSYSPVTA